ncbi:FAD-dependent oxidoreductase [Gulosibacter sp. 10]|uniref:FAD-dependent oxidoreductase n=1 Tax=Gulosibacter sp. 10 TaxID=1255570 RepID=UPI00097EB0D2|nr:FAD-dependent oxidoreductase [Gulosibacter sp. 10]SJM67751.1 Putative sarcosine oxidase [Gulosibacter sp. 10]
METSKYVVIGAGLMGAATAWQLADAGHEVTLLERDLPANDEGSSHGSARIFRFPYPEHQHVYAHLVKESVAYWEELSRRSNRELITRFGSVDFGDVRNPRGLAAVLDSEGIEYELLDADEARSRWPQFAFDTDVLWQPDGGVIDAHNTVYSMIDLAIQSGAQLRTRWEAADITRTATGFLITAKDGRRIRAEEIVVAVGGWIPKLLSRLSLPQRFLDAMPGIQVRQEQAYHFPYADYAEPDRAIWPTFIHKHGLWEAYGLPGGRDADFRGQKLAQFNGGPVLASAEDQDGRIDPANRERVVEYVREYLPGLVPEPYAETTCLFTNAPHEDFVLDRVDGVTVVSPCSGHGGKFAPLIGALAAGLATGTGTVPDKFRVLAQQELAR